MPMPDLRPSRRTAVQSLTAAAVVAVPIAPGDTAVVLGGDAHQVGPALDLDLARLAHQARATGRAGEVIAVPVAREGMSVEQVLLVGVGSASAAELRRAAAVATRRSVGRDRLALAIGAEADSETRRAVVEGAGLAAYAFTRRSAGLDDDRRPVRRVDLLGFPDDEALRRGRVTVAAVHAARELANAPAAELTPAAMAGRAERLAQRHGLAARIRDVHELDREGFGGLVGVGAGSVHPPVLVELSYRPRAADARTPHVVLVGKGITFDSGGLSLKPSAAMVSMKTDMSGSAAVLATMSALADLDVPVSVTGLLAMAENLPSGSALRPGDVITHYDGRTTEVMNTDAEGRLVLADAIGYAATRLQPDTIVDIATLTGAISVALGQRRAGLYATDDALADALVSASEASGEPVWRMPLTQDYRFAIDSPIADQSNTSRDPHVGGGSITAALFLESFAAEVPWAHLDVAGPARSDADVDDVSRGGTGYGTRLLLRWLETAHGIRRRR